MTQVSGRKLKVVVVATHPIQHFVPFYRALVESGGLQLSLLYCSRIGLDAYFDPEMNTEIRWRMDLLGGYQSSFLPEADRIKSVKFWEVNNPQLNRCLASLMPNAVVVYGYSNLTMIRAILWCAKCRVPVLMITDSELLQPRGALTRIAKRVLLPILQHVVSGFLTVGDNNERYWLGYGASRKKLFRVPFTIDEAEFTTARENRKAVSRPFRSKHGIGMEEFVFLLVGKASARKRQIDAINAFKLVLAAGNANVRLLIAGDGPELESLKASAELLGRNVLFLGFVNVNDLPQIYAASDVLVHPSERDPHPLVFSEAACVGLPAVTTDRVGAVGPTDILQDGFNAFIYPVGQVKALANVMTKLINTPSLVEQMSRNALLVYQSQNMHVSVSGMLSAVKSVARAETPKSV